MSLLVGYPKENLDISSITSWNRSCLFQSIESSQRKSFFKEKTVGVKVNLVKFKVLKQTQIN